MKEKFWDAILWLLAFLFVFKDVVKQVLIAVVVLAVVVVATIWMMNSLKEESPELILEDTALSIETVRPRGEIYVCSAVIEDFAVLRESSVGLFSGSAEHSCVQTMVQKCSYILDLDEVTYTVPDSGKSVRIRLPQPQYVASTQGASFLSDDGGYWARKLSSTNDMKKQVEHQIRTRFDTPKNRQKAERYAEEAISEVLKKLGYDVTFERTLERKPESGRSSD